MTEFLEACRWLSQASDSGLDSPDSTASRFWACLALPSGHGRPYWSFFLKESWRQCLCNIWDFGEELSANHCICFCLFFILFILYWSIADLKCCDSFRWTTRGPSHTFTLSILPQTPLPSRLPHNVDQSSLCYTVRPCWLSILNIAECP